jgi:hypothetical protein
MTPALTALLANQNAVFTRAQALQHGISDEEASTALARREWSRVRRGAYTLSAVWADADAARRNVLRLQAVTLTTAQPLVGSHETAAAAQRIELWEPSYEWVHATRPDHSARREGGVWHHRAALPESEVVVVDGLLVTDPLRSAHDIARSGIDHEHAVVAIDSALRVSGRTFEDRAGAYERLRSMHLSRTDWPGARVAGGAVAAADPRCQSVGESRTRFTLAGQGFPEPLSQVYVYDERGRLVGIVDFALLQYKTLVEFDGRLKYGLDGLTPEAAAERLWREKLREDALRRLGWEIVRIVWADLYRPHRIAAEIRAAFTRAAGSAPLQGSYSLSPR